MSFLIYVSLYTHKISTPTRKDFFPVQLCLLCVKKIWKKQLNVKVCNPHSVWWKRNLFTIIYFLIYFFLYLQFTYKKRQLQGVKNKQWMQQNSILQCSTKNILKRTKTMSNICYDPHSCVLKKAVYKIVIKTCQEESAKIRKIGYATMLEATLNAKGIFIFVSIYFIFHIY